MTYRTLISGLRRISEGGATPIEKLLIEQREGKRNMKSTGIVRKVDDLGRVVIPIELRRTLGIDVRDSLEISMDADRQIIIKKYQPGCVICSELEDLTTHKGKQVCQSCRKELSK